MDAGLFNRILNRHGNLRREKKLEEGKKSPIIPSFLKPTESLKLFPVYYKDDDYIKKISHKNVSPFIENNEVTFLYWGKSKLRVDLISELSFWTTNNNTPMKKIKNEDLYHITLYLPDTARLEYKFFVDGKWYLDKLNPLKCENGIGDYNSYLLMPNYKKVNEIFPREGIKKGSLIEYEFSGKNIEGKRMIYVYLPFEYSLKTDKKYPTIYFHDGADYINRGNAVNTLDNLIYDNIIEPIIAVFINPINRFNEYMYNIKYSKLIVEEIIPNIDSNFRTIKSPEGRAIMGASLGGIISFFTAYNFPKYFKNIAGQSSSFLYLEKEITKLIMNSHEEFNVYMDVGLFESLIYSNRRISKIYKEKQFNFKYQEITEGHTWSNWGNHVKDALIFFWGKK
ncbi:MAG: ferric enterobactin esterase [Candidatus Sericytochromatia bacterium]|nr:MAG: ferric enterobactin esterase [Candidatus Sericytochromatia bacterium]